jgi:hypothetical protein
MTVLLIIKRFEAFAEIMQCSGVDRKFSQGSANCEASSITEARQLAEMALACAVKVVVGVAVEEHAVLGKTQSLESQIAHYAGVEQFLGLGFASASLA